MAEKSRNIGIFEAVRNNPDIVSDFLDVSGTVIVVLTDENYTVKDCNENLPRSLYVPEKPIGRPLGEILCPLENPTLTLLVSRRANALLPQILKVCYTDILYKCYSFAMQKGYLVIGDRLGGTDNEVLESMSLLNNELSGLSRELGRKNRELERANQKISELMRTDALTGLANRRYFQERFEEAFSLSRRHRGPLSVLMIDLDFFKKINDTYGHGAGDDVLRQFGALLKQVCREEDFPARFGGEEFIVFLPNTRASDAEALAQRVREELSKLEIFPVAQKITASIGIAERLPEDSPESLVNRVDKAMYEAKQQGRNRCVVG